MDSSSQCQSPMPGVPGMESDPLASPHLWCPSCLLLVLTQVWFPAVSVPFYPLQCGLLSLINSGKFVLPTFGSLSVVLLCFLSWCVHATTWAQGPPPLPIFPEPPRTHFKTGEPQEENVWSWEKDGVTGAAPYPHYKYGSVLIAESSERAKQKGSCPAPGLL